MKIEKIVVLGSSGFIGNRIIKSLERGFPVAELQGFSSTEIDLTKRVACDRLGQLLNEKTVVVFCSGIKKQLGDNLENFGRNIEMVKNYCDVAASSKARTIFISTADVYGEDRDDLDLSEDSSPRLTSYYGIAKHSSECLLTKTLENVAILRAPFVYGSMEPTYIYGPSGFLRKAAAGEQIVLWGDGSEKREFLFVDDLSELVSRLVNSTHVGISNVTRGESDSFAGSIELISELLGKEVLVENRARTRKKVDQGFQPGRFHDWFSDFSLCGVAEGLETVIRQEELQRYLPAS